MAVEGSLNEGAPRKDYLEENANSSRKKSLSLFCSLKKEKKKKKKRKGKRRGGERKDGLTLHLRPPGLESASSASVD